MRRHGRQRLRQSPATRGVQVQLPPTETAKSMPHWQCPLATVSSALLAPELASSKMRARALSLLLCMRLTNSVITVWPRTSLTLDPGPNYTANHFGTIALSRTSLCAVIGAGGSSMRAGKAFSLFRNATGSVWSAAPAPLLLPASATEGFGMSVALPRDCNVAYVGAPYAGFSSGRVYTYIPCATNPSGWCLKATLSITDGTLPTFGTSIATNAGGWGLAVGAKNSGSQKGSVYFLTPAQLNPQADIWYLEIMPTVLGAASGDYLGSAVWISDDATIIIATAPYRSGGLAFVYRRPGSGAVLTSPWSVNATLDPGVAPCSLTGSNRNFGFSVAATPNGDVVIVGAPLGGAQRGTAVIFERDDTTIGAPYRCVNLLYPGASQTSDSVGQGVAISADGLSAFVSGVRTVHVFTRVAKGSAWSETGALPGPNPTAFNENYGVSFQVTSVGTSALVGAPGSSTAADTYVGYATLLDRDLGLSPTPSPSTRPSPTATTSPGAPPSSTPTASESPTSSPSPTPTNSASTTETPTTSPSTSPSPSDSDSPTATMTRGASPSTSPTESQSMTPSGTSSVSLGSSPSTSPTVSPSMTPSSFATPPSGSGVAAGAGVSVGGAVGGTFGALILVGAAGFVFVKGRSFFSARKTVLSQFAAPSGESGAVFSNNPASSAAPPQLPRAPDLPPGWSVYRDDTDTWYVDSFGNSHWELPAPSSDSVVSV